MRDTSTPLSSAPWHSARSLRFGSDRKHEVGFDPGMPFSIQFFIYDIDHKVTPNFHDYLEVCYVESGSGLLSLGGEELTLGEGDTALVGSKALHHIRPDDREPLRMALVFFMPELLYTAGDSDVDLQLVAPFYDARASAHLVKSGRDTRDVSGLLAEMLREKDDAGPYHRQAIKNLLERVLITIYRAQADTLPADTIDSRTRRDTERLVPCLDFLSANSTRKVTLDEAAKVACMSPAYFSRFFKRVTGTPFSSYMMRLRIDAAKDMLLETDYPIGRVALEVGFKTPQHMTRVFKEIMGCTPGEFVGKASVGLGGE